MTNTPPHPRLSDPELLQAELRKLTHALTETRAALYGLAIAVRDNDPLTLAMQRAWRVLGEGLRSRRTDNG